MKVDSILCTAWIIYVYNQCCLTHLMSGTLQHQEFMLHYMWYTVLCIYITLLSWLCTKFSFIHQSLFIHQFSSVLRSTREVGIIGVSFGTSAAASTSMLCVQGGDVLLGCGQSRGWQVTPSHGPNAPVSLKLGKLQLWVSLFVNSELGLKSIWWSIISPTGAAMK